MADDDSDDDFQEPLPTRKRPLLASQPGSNKVVVSSVAAGSRVACGGAKSARSGASAASAHQDDTGEAAPPERAHGAAAGAHAVLLTSPSAGGSPGRERAWGASPAARASPAPPHPRVDVAAVVERLRLTKTQVRHAAWVPARPACHDAPPGFQLPCELAAVLGRAGALPLYSHQSAAIAAALAGRSVVVSTPTASGKSICYLAPLLHALSDDGRAARAGRALVLMPLKALAHDQLRATRALLALAAECADAAAAASPPALPAASIARLRRMAALRCEAYDGDTPMEERAELRKGAQIIFTNVDMLHRGILPNHAVWPARFWQNLKHVVLDEAHVYTGVFGSHAALLFRRLRRVAAHYGAAPSFLCSSATIAQPAAHVAALTGLPDAACVADSGAPAGRKALLLWQPPELPPSAAGGDAPDADASAAPQRKSVYHEAGELLAEIVAAGLKPLVFVSARMLSEIVANNGRVALRERGLAGAAAGVESYRGGYSAAERRSLEERLRNGSITAIVSTSALELGIDVGALDATVHVGVPDTAAAQWQQAGRAGRRAEAGASLAVVIAAERPLDAYYLGNPAELATRPAEPAHVDPRNAALLALHLPLAAKELSLVSDDAEHFGGAAAFERAIAAGVAQHALVYHPGRRAYDCTLADPAARVAIRNGLSRDEFALHDGEKMHAHGGPCADSLVEAVDAATAFMRLHVGALFRHRQHTYEVVALNPERRLAHGRKVPDAPLATSPQLRVAVRELHVAHRRGVGAATAYLGRVHVTSRVIGFIKKDLMRNKKVFEKEFPPPGLPGLDLETDGVWFELPPEVTERLLSGGQLRQATAGARNLLTALLPPFIACDAGDVGAVLALPDANAGMAPPGADADVSSAVKLYVYDAFGGVGLCEQVYAGLEELWRRALAVLERCPCATGCASCTQAGRQGAEAGTAKPECRTVLQGLLGAWMSDAPAGGAAGSASAF